MSLIENNIKTFFQNQTIFLTGGTGFLGKVLLAKLLGDCQEIRKIYVLIRAKKGKKLEERFEELFKQPCFDSTRDKHEDFIKKVSLVGGDCQKPHLGISAEDLEVLKKETTCVLHVAANVQFDQSLREAALNVQGTRDLIKLATKMVHLKAFVYISTAYSNCINIHIKEEVYNPPIQAECLLQMIDHLDDETLNRITPSLLGKWPNTYVYTKSVSEKVVQDAAQFFPTAIVRPGIVLNSVEEPVCGWIDNLYGPLGLTIGAGLGVIHSFHAKPTCWGYMVPVDYTCNCILAALWKTATDKHMPTVVYNYAGFEKDPITWGRYMEIMSEFYRTTVSRKAIWYYSFTLNKHKILNDTYIILMHKLPAHIIDGVLFCLGKKPKVVKLYKKLDKVLELIAYFARTNWHFDNDNVRNLWNEMNDNEKKLFKFTMKDIDWYNYLYNCVLGMKQYVLKEKVVPVDLRWRLKLLSMQIMHYIVVALFFYLIYKFLAFFFGLVVPS